MGYPNSQQGPGAPYLVDRQGAHQPELDQGSSLHFPSTFQHIATTGDNLYLWGSGYAVTPLTVTLNTQGAPCGSFPISVSLSPSVRLSVHLYVRQFVHLSVRLSVHLSVHPSVCPSVCLLLE